MKKENQFILDLLKFSLDKKLKNKIKSSLKGIKAFYKYVDDKHIIDKLHEIFD